MTKMCEWRRSHSHLSIIMKRQRKLRGEKRSTQLCTHTSTHHKRTRRTCCPGVLCLSTKSNKLAGGQLALESGVWPEHAALKKEPHCAVSGHRTYKSCVSTFLLLVVTNTQNEHVWHIWDYIFNSKLATAANLNPRKFETFGSFSQNHKFPQTAPKLFFFF